ncbi:MAG: MBL fold metallo-hydrolase [Candidatus Moranbacteria bacterium]|nr:MBL fold metallo-hydrolase [Candidatus Moranbacteria bacterium]
MRNRKIFFSIICGLFVLTLILSVIILHSKNEALSVIFLDIGQGDAILISQGAQQVLIDGGKDGKLLLEKLGKYVPFWDRNIETIIETHPDQDHIGGLIAVAETYNIETVVKTKMQNDSQTFKKLEALIEENEITRIEAKKNLEIKFQNGANLKILYPFESIININAKDTNASSVVSKLKFGENEFLMTGDLPTTQENELLKDNINISADFLKVSHHGSKYATSNEFLEKVGPSDAIISVGKNNSYGHPNPELMQRLTSHRIKIIRTDESRDIKYECKNLNEKCQRVSNQ